MKCPKCGYISFDYNQLCPRCNKNIGSEQEKFNLPTFRPDPPSLLGFLTGEANESNVNLHPSSGSRIDKISSEEIGLSDSVILDRDNLDIDEKDLDISFEPQESEPEEDLFGQGPQAEPEKRLSDADFRLERRSGDEVVTPVEQDEEKDISLDLGDLALEGSGETLDRLQHAGAAQGVATDEGISLESLDSLPADIEGDLDEIESEIELDLDDLKVSDMGNLEIGVDTRPSVMEMDSTLVESEAGTLEPKVELADEAGEKLPDISELVLEEADAGTKEKTMILDDLSIDESGTSDKKGVLESGEISYEDFNLGEKELLEDMENLDLNRDYSGDKERAMLFDDIDMKDSIELEKSFDISDISIDEDYSEKKAVPGLKEPLSDESDLELDLDAMSLDVDEYQKRKDSGDDFVLDLDDMDIDLDLNEPKKKS